MKEILTTILLLVVTVLVYVTSFNIIKKIEVENEFFPPSIY